jgi:hypothetical protein
MTAPRPDPTAITPPVRIRSRLWLRVAAPLAAVGAAAVAVLALVDGGRSPLAAVALALLSGLVTGVAWWGEIAIDAQRLAVRVVQRDGNVILAMDLVRIVGLNAAPWWRGGSTLVVQDTTGRTVAIGGGYFPLRRVWRVLGPHLEANPEVVLHPSLAALVS